MLKQKRPLVQGEWIKVLDVEDNPADYDLIAEMLEASALGRFQLDRSPRLSSALEQIERNAYDIVLLDLNLPDSIGIDTFLRFHSAHPDIPVIVLTGSTDEELALRAVNEGAQDYLFKDDVNERNLGHSIVFGIQRKRIEQQVVEEKRRADLYIDLLTHDIKNLNAAAAGYLQLIEGGDERSRELVTKSMNALDDSSELIDSVVKLQRSREARVERGPVDLSDLLRQAVNAVSRPHGREVSISFTPASGHRALGNGLLRDVFMNIIENAVKHSQKDIVIGIGLDTVDKKGQEFQRVSVEDTGPGVPDELKDQIFYRAQRGRTGAVGRGIGLFLVRQLVEDLGGEVWVEDRVPGESTKGARFVVVLPSAEDRSAPFQT